MTTALIVTSSLSGASSHSNRLLARFAERLALAEPGTTIIRRDLGRQPIAPLDGARLGALATPAETRSAEQAVVAAESDALVAELKAADVLLLGAPMYNFTVPSQLKSWFDHVARAGVTFRYTAAGPQGLLTGKRAVLVTTRGGRHQGRPEDHVVPFVKTMLAFIGITELEVVYAEGLAIGERERHESLAAAEARIDALTASALAA
jgi:FMN-dependent NADH-azoreductase